MRRRTNPPPLNRTERRLFGRARMLIESGWCQDHYAIDGSGQPTAHMSRRARCFCVEGAILRAMAMLDIDIDGFADEPINTYGRRFMEFTEPHDCKVHGPQCPYAPCFNDREGTTEEDVLAVFDRMGVTG